MKTSIDDAWASGDRTIERTHPVVGIWLCNVLYVIRGSTTSLCHCEAPDATMSINPGVLHRDAFCAGGEEQSYYERERMSKGDTVVFNETSKAPQGAEISSWFFDIPLMLGVPTAVRRRQRKHSMLQFHLVRRKAGTKEMFAKLWVV